MARKKRVRKSSKPTVREPLPPIQTVKRPRGRPPGNFVHAFTEEIANEICASVASGMSLRDFCKQEGRPSRPLIYFWRESNPDFAARFARALELHADEGFDEIREIARDGTGDTWVDDRGRTRTNHDVVSRSQLRCQMELKRLAVLNPRRYRERATAEDAVENLAKVLADLLGDSKAARDNDLGMAKSPEDES